MKGVYLEEGRLVRSQKFQLPGLLSVIFGGCTLLQFFKLLLVTVFQLGSVAGGWPCLGVERDRRPSFPSLLPRREMVELFVAAGRFEQFFKPQ